MIATPSFQPVRLARAYPREAAIAAGALAFSAAAMASVIHFHSSTDFVRRPIAAQAAPPPTVPEMALRPIAPEQAMALNESAPVTGQAGPAAAPFIFAAASENARGAALDCLTQAIYYEAGNEINDGQRAVAQVILNRVRHPAFPASVCGVVYQGSTRPTGCQFTFTCDGSLNRHPDAAGWRRAREVAAAALHGSVYGAVGNATHYHANYVVPTWSATLARTDIVGAHLFYRWNGNWGRPGAFVQPYGGREASAEGLRQAALSAHKAYIAAGTPTAGHEAEAVALARVNGLPVTRAPDGRVSMHFTPQARAAVEAALSRPRITSPADTALNSTLDAGTPAADQKPFGT